MVFHCELSLKKWFRGKELRQEMSTRKPGDRLIIMKVDTEGIRQISHYPLFFNNVLSTCGDARKGVKMTDKDTKVFLTFIASFFYRHY